MNRSRKALIAGAALLVAAGVTVQGSSHREAPGITGRPKLDGTDFYMFRSYEPGRQDYVTLIANYVPLQDAYGGPNFFTLDPRAVYEIHVDNNGDAREDLTFQFGFHIAYKNIAVPAGGVQVPIPLINAGPIGPGAGDTANLNVIESYSINLIRGSRGNATQGRGHQRDDRQRGIPQAGRSHRRQVDRGLPGLRRQPRLRHRHPGVRRRTARCSSASAARGSSSTWPKHSTS